MSDRYSTLQRAVFQRYENNTPWNDLSVIYNVDATAIRRAFQSFIDTPTEAQPLCPSDIHFTLRSRGRPSMFLTKEEKTIANAVTHYATNNTPLTKNGVQDLVQHYVERMPEPRKEQITFKDNRPSLTWIDTFSQRNKLSYKSVRVIDDKRVQAITPNNVTRHIARLKAAMNRYHIKDSRFVFNMDQSGASFSKMIGRSLRKGVGPIEGKLVHAAIQVRGNLDRVTLMPVVSAAGVAYTPVIVYPGKQAHYRRVRGEVQTLHSFLPKCYLYQREVPGVDTQIIYSWAKQFVNETKELRCNGQHILLVIDGYGSHVQWKTLQLFKDNNIIVIAMPAHSSHELQPLDVSVFSSYKSQLQKEIHSFALRKKKLDAFDIASCITTAYSISVTASNIISGFERTGIWVGCKLGPSIEPLKHLFPIDENANPNTSITLESLLESFGRKGRSLLRDGDVDEDGTIKVNTTYGAHLTSEAVLVALWEREKRKLNKKTQESEEARELKLAYKEPKKDIERYGFLAPRRIIMRKNLDTTRSERRWNQIGRVRDRLFQEHKMTNSQIADEVFNLEYKTNN